MVRLVCPWVCVSMAVPESVFHGSQETRNLFMDEDSCILNLFYSSISGCSLGTSYLYEYLLYLCLEEEKFTKS